ncbi:MAG: hypothetical protein ABSD75_13300 [Terriglobales bacterium]|jgi:hypothetical protein
MPLVLPYHFKTPLALSQLARSTSYFTECLKKNQPSSAVQEFALGRARWVASMTKPAHAGNVFDAQGFAAALQLAQGEEHG